MLGAREFVTYDLFENAVLLPGSSYIDVFEISGNGDALGPSLLSFVMRQLAEMID